MTSEDFMSYGPLLLCFLFFGRFFSHAIIVLYGRATQRCIYIVASYLVLVNVNKHLYNINKCAF